MEFNAALPNPILTLTAQAPGTVPSAGLLNDHCRGVTFTFTATAVTGSPTLQIALFAVDLATQAQVQIGITTVSSVLTNASVVVAQFYPGLSNTSPFFNVLVPLAFVVKLIVAGASSTLSGTLSGNLQS